jgi:anti-sigma B factor antagonist
MNYHILGSINTVAVINPGKDVLGGTQALSFTGTIGELLGKDVKRVVIDLSDVELINSSGIGMLVSGLSTLKKHDIELVLASVPDKVTALLQMTHLIKVFAVYPDVVSASESQ